MTGQPATATARVECAGNRARVVRAGRLIDGTGAQPRHNVTVVIEGDTIQSVVDDLTYLPDGRDVEVIDASSATVMPGIVNAHVHLNGDIFLEPYRRYLDPPWDLRVLHAAQQAETYLRSGVTTVRDMGLTSPALALRQAALEGLIDGPRLLTAGKALTTTSGHGDWTPFPQAWVRDMEPRGAFCDGVDQCRRAVRDNFRNEVDLIKIFASSGAVTNPASDIRPHPNFSDEEIGAIVQEAHEHDLRVAAHVFGKIPLRRTVTAGVDTIEHCILPPEDWGLLDLLPEHDVTLIPTLTILWLTAEVGAEWGVQKEGQEAAARVYENSSRMVEEARRRGVTIAAGTDAIGKFMAGDSAMEMALLCESGLSPLEALTAGTGGAAAALGIEHRVGTVEPGKLADLLVVEGNPLENIKILQDPAALRTVLFTRTRVHPRPSRTPA